jgi:hypothetical protein
VRASDDRSREFATRTNIACRRRGSIDVNLHPRQWAELARDMTDDVVAMRIVLIFASRSERMSDRDATLFDAFRRRKRYA